LVETHLPKADALPPYLAVNAALPAARSVLQAFAAFSVAASAAMVAAWAFAAVGLGAGAGVATAVVYGVMSLVAALPGLLVLVADRRTADPVVVAEKEPVHA